jgi:hypothetical protein
MVTGIELALGESLLEDDGLREFMVLFDEGDESSRRAEGPSFSFRGVSRSRRFDAGAAVKEEFERYLMVSGASPADEIDMSGGLCLLRAGDPSDPDKVDAGLVLLSCDCPFGRLESNSLAPDSSPDEVLPASRGGIVSTSGALLSSSFSVTGRLRGDPSGPLRLLPALTARVILTRSFPSITFAGGGGCNIHLVSSLLAGCVLTTGGCRSFTGGFLAK